MTQQEPIFLIGNNNLTFSIAACLLRGGHKVTLCTENKEQASDRIQIHFEDMSAQRSYFNPKGYEVTDQINDNILPKIVIILTNEDLQIKKAIIHQVEVFSGKDTIIGINAGSIPLDKLQENAVSPERIIGLNWTEPAHTTSFLELVVNTVTSKNYINKILSISKSNWDKDPYIVSCGYSIRARLFAALAREAFYLVQNNYATVEDIDRACRNDPGYYMPFSGECRYMDLMGAYAYGIVMKSLNPELSKNSIISPFFENIIENGDRGMENGKGFYSYAEEGIKEYDSLAREFSYKIQKIIKKYPFDYLKKSSSTNN